jgi:beta-phosphoglucomutase-like phosphatase (HAD superfamily)
MLTMLTTLAGPVIDLSEIPWTAITIGVGVAWALLEARLVKAGFVRQKALDAACGQISACVTMKDFNGLSDRLDAKLTAGEHERESTSRQLIMARTDLDNTRDRTTRLEGQHERLVDSLKPLPGIESTLRELLVQQERLVTEVENLKRGR